MKHKNIIFIGGGGHCKSVIDIVENFDWTILGILDTAENLNKTVLGYKIIGTDDQISEYADKAFFLITVGQIQKANSRINLHNKILSAGGELATIIASDAHVSKYSNIGKGTVIMHKAIVNAAAQIGSNCIINTFANIEHDAIVGDFCHISTGVMVNGNCSIGNETFIGSGAVISNGVSIAEKSVIAAGSLVRKNLLTSGIYAGSPVTKYK